MYNNIDADWKGLYELLNDLIRCKGPDNLQEKLTREIDTVIPADCGAPFFSFREKRPICIRWPAYSESFIPDFNNHFNAVCPEKYNAEEQILGPVSWKRYRNSEYDTDFNRPLNIGFSLGKGFRNPETGEVLILVLNRSRNTLPFSRKDVDNLNLIMNSFSELYLKNENSAGSTKKRISEIEAGNGNRLLSQRELEVTEFLVMGGTMHHIALILGISPRTVETHIVHIYEKLNVRNRKELIRLMALSDQKNR